MELSPFNSYYEIFAGISAALVGVTQIREFITRKFTAKFEDESVALQGSIDSTLLHLNEFNQILKDMETQKVGESLNFRREVNEDLTKLYYSMAVLVPYRYKLNITVEVEKVERICYILFLLNFLCCIFFILVAGLHDINFISENTLFRSVIHMDVFGLVIMIWITWNANRTSLKDISGFKFAFIGFILAFACCIFCILFFHEAPPVHNLAAVFLSLVLCVAPFLALCFRTFYLWNWRFDRIRREKRTANDIISNKRTLQKEFEDISRHIMKMDDPAT